MNPVSFETSPDRYNHWKLSFDGPIATLTLDVAEDKGLAPGYKLKLNSYDLGVDIELHDALNRIRFEHPEVRTVVVTSGKNRMFCSGANIYMLGTSSHAWKVNFCKFTNETRNGVEDSSKHSGLKFIAALNGACAGGGYEMALACDEIFMVDDRSSAVSLPEVPLLGVLPGTGGLTRLVDKRKVRRDLADLFCTTAEGVRADRAKEWGLVNHIAKPQEFAEAVKKRAEKLALLSDRPKDGKGVPLTPLGENRIVHVEIDKEKRVATLSVDGPEDVKAERSADWYPLRLARELDRVILDLRTNQLDVGLWVFKTRGDPKRALELDGVLKASATDWFVRETIGYLRRTLARLDVSSRSIFAIIEPGSCFAGTLMELALAADRSFMLDAEGSQVGLSHLNFDAYPMVNGLSRLDARFCGRAPELPRNELLDASRARELGLVTSTPDELDWEDEIRLAIEERASLSPDALTGMEASLRFAGPETMLTRVFGRLTAWQNWIFNRPNAVGEQGALKVYGSGAKPKFNWERV
jgi:benzoyl-CoA-dihydrodiol lyase